MEAVAGETVVAKALQRDSEFAPDLIIAAGKAASSMCKGAIATVPRFGRAIVATKYGHAEESLSQLPNVVTIQAGHPQPDNNSLRAGDAIMSAVRAQSDDAKLLMLISGGASSLVEVLANGTNLESLRDETQKMLAAGVAIHAINKQRMKLSLIKNGELLRHFRGKEARVYAISDVQGDAIELIGSGLGDAARAACKSSARIVASNAIARQKIAAAATAAGLVVQRNEETLYADVFKLAPGLARDLQSGKSGVYIWGGEPTIELPPKPGKGGRNQSLALAIAREIKGCEGITVLVAGTDGTDGPTNAAGAFADGSTFDDADRAQAALLSADRQTPM